MVRQPVSNLQTVQLPPFVLPQHLGLRNMIWHSENKSIFSREQAIEREIIYYHDVCLTKTCNKTEACYLFSKCYPIQTTLDRIKKHLWNTLRYKWSPLSRWWNSHMWALEAWSTLSCEATKYAGTSSDW